VKEEMKRGKEGGQALVLFALVAVVLFGFTALAIDVGFFLRHRAVVQQAVDASALAAAQELPGDKAQAEQMAREYAEKNGIDPDTLEIVFSCTSQFQLACDAGADKWDTIRVKGHMDVPFFFAPVLKLAGADDECFLGTCPAISSAAACRGLCGSSPFQAVDVVTIIDHTASMSSTDLANAKDGALSLYQYFNSNIQYVGLGVTPPVDPTNHCDSIDAWGDPGVWLPVPLSSDYKNSSGGLNYSSALVNTTSCLDRPSSGELPGVHTKIGDVIKAATAELQTNGRPGEKWGIIFLSDGAANIYHAPTVPGSTGWLSPTANAAVTSSAGDNNGFEGSPTAAYADGGSSASDLNSGTSTSTSCTSTAKDRHRYQTFGVSLPSGSSVTGIEVRLDARVDAASGTRRMCVELSWDGGSSWTTAKTTANLGTSEQSYFLGGSSDNWGRSWTSSNLSNTNFRVRITDVADSTSRDFYLDWVATRVHYTTPLPAEALGPCDYAKKQADAAKAAGIEVFVIAWGADDRCDYDSTSSPWYRAQAVTLLQAMATDELHFFNEPKTTDLEPIFQVVGTQLATGSRLVPVSQ
jgi:hypothetical protein